MLKTQIARNELPPSRHTLFVKDAYGEYHEITVDLVLRKFDATALRATLADAILANEEVDDMAAFVAAGAAVKELQRVDFVSALVDRNILHIERDN